MPEGPEVKKIAESLAEKVGGRQLLSYEILGGRYQKHGPPDGFDSLHQSMPINIVGAGCHGKFIFIIFEGGASLWSTLGMTGSWSSSIKKHSRVKFILDSGEVFFSDMRNFGTLRFTPDRKILIDKISSLGPDMLSEDVSDERFSERINLCKSKTIAQAIMDQSIIAGVGNYLKSESLYYSKISPHRVCNTLSREEMSLLNRTIKKIIRDSYSSGGATIQSYKGFNGEIGEYSRRFAV